MKSLISLLSLLALSCAARKTTANSSDLAEVSISNLPAGVDAKLSKLNIQSSKGTENYKFDEVAQKSFTAGIEYSFSVQLVNAKSEIVAETKEGVAGCSSVKKVLKAGANDISIMACETKTNKPIPGGDASARINIGTMPDPSLVKNQTLDLKSAVIDQILNVYFEKVSQNDVNAAEQIFQNKNYFEVDNFEIREISNYDFTIEYYDTKKRRVMIMCHDSAPADFKVKDRVKVFGVIVDQPRTMRDMSFVYFGAKNCLMTKAN